MGGAADLGFTPGASTPRSVLASSRRGTSGASGCLERCLAPERQRGRQRGRGSYLLQHLGEREAVREVDVGQVPDGTRPRGAP